MKTVTVRVDQTGAPATNGTVAVANTDDQLKYSTAAVFYDGVIKLRVPQGHYAVRAQASSLVGGFTTRDAFAEAIVMNDATHRRPAERHERAEHRDAATR